MSRVWPSVLLLWWPALVAFGAEAVVTVVQAARGRRNGGQHEVA